MWDSPLTMLRLDHNLLIDDNAVRALCSALRNKRTLKQLSLGYCGYSSAGAAAISKLLLLHTGIEDLSVRGNYLGAEGLTHLAPALAATRSLLRLDLAGTGIGRPVIDSLHGWSSDKVIHSTHCTYGRVSTLTVHLVTACTHLGPT